MRQLDELINTTAQERIDFVKNTLCLIKESIQMIYDDYSLEMESGNFDYGYLSDPSRYEERTGAWLACLENQVSLERNIRLS